MEIQNTKEAFVNLTVPAGEYGSSVDFKPVEGRVIGCKIFKDSQDNKGNTGFVNAAIKDTNGLYVSNFHHIDNYRDRDCAYHESGKPLNFDVNKRSFTFEVLSSSQFAEDFKVQLIFIYKDERDQNCDY